MKPLSLLLLMSSMLALCSCGKNEESNATPPAPPSEAQPTATAPAQPPMDLNQAAFQARISEVQTLRNSDLEKAADALLALQRQKLTAQQAEAVAGQMRQFQANLSAGVASGDARAIAAANKLRQSATVR